VWLAELMATWFEIKVRGIVGPEAKDLNEIVILNRTLKWKPWGIRITADLKHVEKIVRHVGLDSSSKSVVSPGEKGSNEDDEKADKEELDENFDLSGKETTVFRGLAATANYLSSDRYDIQFASKELCRDMSKPSQNSMVKSKTYGPVFGWCPSGPNKFR